MSRLFGPMRQVGIVVRDIDKAMHHWVEVCGVGPWFYAELVQMTEFRYRGRGIRHPDVGRAGKFRRRAARIDPAALRQARASTAISSPAGTRACSTGRAGRSTITRSASGHLQSGWEIGEEGDTPRGSFIYFLNEGHPGTVVEIAEATPIRMRIFDQVREASLNWNGSDPIRMNWPQG